MTKSIKIWKNRLEITKDEKWYTINDKNVDLIFHIDALRLGGNEKPSWLWLFNKATGHIGSIWISTDTDMKKIKKFLEDKK